MKTQSLITQNLTSDKKKIVQKTPPGNSLHNFERLKVLYLDSRNVMETHEMPEEFLFKSKPERELCQPFCWIGLILWIRNGHFTMGGKQFKRTLFIGNLKCVGHKDFSFINLGRTGYGLNPKV